jgi:hypothetical protein
MQRRAHQGRCGSCNDLVGTALRAFAHPTKDYEDRSYFTSSAAFCTTSRGVA